MIKRAIAAIYIASLPGLIGCSGEIPENSVTTVTTSHVRFKDVTEEAGLTLRSKTFAVAAGDLNADGFPDLVLSLHGRLALYVNQQDGTFANADSIADFTRADTHGVSLVDINDDGWPDIFVSVSAGRGRGEGANHLYLNQEGRRFVRDDTLDPLLEYAKGRGRSVCPTDMNEDGLTDLILMTMFQPDRPHRLAIATPGDPSRFSDAASGTTFGQRQAAAIATVDLDGEGDTSYLLGAGGLEAGALYRRSADGAFDDQSRQLGLAPKWDVRSIVPFDYDRDGDFDLFVTRSLALREGAELAGRRLYFNFDSEPDRTRKVFRIRMPKDIPFEIDVRFEGLVQPNKLHLGRNRVNPEQLPITLDSGDSLIKGDPDVNPSVDAGGYLWRNTNGDLVFEFVGVKGTIESVAGYMTADFERAAEVHVTGIQPRRAGRNNLYRNDNGRFSEVAKKAGLAARGLGRAALAADFDNDGNLDIYVVTGGQLGANPPNQLFMNRGDGTFWESARAAGATGPTEGRGDSAVAFDYDRDGDLDLVLLNGADAWPNNDGPIVLLRNDTASQGGSLQVDLRGSRGNALSMGASMTAEMDGQELYQQRFCNNGHMATHVLPFHLGLGEAPQARLTVRWPSGQRTTTLAPAGSSLILEEPEREERADDIFVRRKN